MTPSMNMGMKGPQQAGLASIAQPAAQPRGKSPESIGEIMALAKKLSDGDLADILAGKSMAVPQYVAMTEAMGRRSLRNAVKGAQAITQANQPSVKDKFMMAEAAEQMPQMPQQQMPQMPQQQMPQMAADGGLMYEEGGLAMLPADNMQSMDMAGGGIIAFAGKGESLVKEPEFGTPEYDEKYGAPGSLKRRFKGISDYYNSPGGSGDFGRNVSNTMNALGPVSAATSAFNVPRTGGAISNLVSRTGNFLGLSGAADPVFGGGDQPNVIPIPNEAPASSAPPVVSADKDKGGAANPNSPNSGGLSDLAAYEDLLKKRTTDYLSKYEGLEDKKRARVAGVKKGLESQVLLDASSALLGSRNLAEAGGKFGSKTASTLAAARTEENQLEDAADQYGFNIAKAREAAEKGDMQLALQYTQLANQNKYQMGSLDVARDRNKILGEGGNLSKVSLALGQAEKQALNEAKQKFPVLTKSNQAAYDLFLRNRSRELKMGNPLTKQYADFSGSDLGSAAFNVVQSTRKGANVIDPTEG